MSLGPVMMDLVGTTVSDQEIELLHHPQTGGVILFTRNFASIDQLSELVAAIRALREPQLLIAVDHEGGRVQRFRTGFTMLPPSGRLGEIYGRDPKAARRLASTVGWLMGAELRAVDIDFSFAPVLDLAHGVSGVIGDRAFHRNPEAVADLAHHLVLGLRDAGMAAVGKHFPGHGGVKEDSHIALPIDDRRTEDILAEDVVPFERLIHYGIPGMMPAHVVYSRCDERPAGYSAYWLQEVLRGRLGFQGAIFSDDLSMEAAHVGGDCGERAKTALEAGCDMVLICNHPQGAMQALEFLERYEVNPASLVRLSRMRGRKAPDYDALHQSARWHSAVQAVCDICGDSPELELNV